MYTKRQQRVVDRFYERLAYRDPAITQSLSELYLNDEKHRSMAGFFVEPEKFGDIARDGTSAYREYMVKEGI